MTNVTIVDQPEVNPNPVSPSMVKNVIIGAVAGIVISLGYLLLTYLLDTKIKNGEQAEQYLGVLYWESSLSLRNNHGIY